MVMLERIKQGRGSCQEETAEFWSSTATSKFQLFDICMLAIKGEDTTRLGQGELQRSIWWLHCPILMHFSELYLGATLLIK